MKKILIFLISTLTFVTQAQVKCIAHRGLTTGGALPNSLSSIVAGYEAQVEGIEFDIRHTKDGYGVLAHNEDLSEFIGDNCHHEQLLADTTKSELLEICTLANGEQIKFFGEAVDYLQNVVNTMDINPILMVELKDETVSERTINNLLHLQSFYPHEKLRYISFEETAINQVATVETLNIIKRLWITVLPYNLYKEKKQERVVADGISFSSRGYAGKLSEIAMPKFLGGHAMPTFTLPTITDKLWRKNYLNKMAEKNLETAVWLNWSANAYSVSFKKYADYTNIDMCRYLKRNIGSVVVDDPAYCMDLRDNLPEKCKSLGHGHTDAIPKH